MSKRGMGKVSFCDLQDPSPTSLPSSARPKGESSEIKQYKLTPQRLQELQEELNYLKTVRERPNGFLGDSSTAYIADRELFPPKALEVYGLKEVDPLPLCRAKQKGKGLLQMWIFLLGKVPGGQGGPLGRAFLGQNRLFLPSFCQAARRWSARSSPPRSKSR